ncbi:MAG: hypothetical protein GY862_36620 [Gammaproteobacteria bacterium]|nr:hypothetical protein [Gammaproteobacteria bacterium]
MSTNPARYRNHYYDPINGRGYRYGFVLRGEASPDWGLEDGEHNFITQRYSFDDARDYLYEGLTLEGKKERENRLTLLFRTLGQVIHLVEDMGQPAHTRNDSHAMGSFYEVYTNQYDIRKNLPFSGYSKFIFPNARDYWHTDDS